MPKEGYKPTKEHKENLSESHKGLKYPNRKSSSLSVGHKRNIAKANSGKKCHLWKHGMSKEWKKRYYDVEYKIWRISVFERDNYTCQNCRQRGIYITAHHIKSWAHYPDFRYDIENGATLCEECHSLTDNYKGRNRKKSK